MGITLAILVVELTVVTRGCHTHSTHFQNGLQFLVDGKRVFYRFINADAPCFHAGVLAFHYYFSTDVHHVVIHAFLVQQTGYSVHSIPFGNGAAIQHQARVFLDNLTVFQLNLLIADELSETIDHAWFNLDGVLESESPSIHQRSYRNVERTIRFSRNVLSQFEYLCEVFVQRGVLVVVDAGNDRVRIVGREGLVHFHHRLLNFVLQVVRMLISYFVYRTEYHSFVGSERRLFL